MAAPDDPGMCKGRAHITEEAGKASDDNISHMFKKMMAFKITDQFKKCLKPCQ